MRRVMWYLFEVVAWVSIFAFLLYVVAMGPFTWALFMAAPSSPYAVGGRVATPHERSIAKRHGGCVQYNPSNKLWYSCTNTMERRNNKGESM